jgi:glycosyltransferase involved in cell wall biosynthesis
MSGTAGLVSVVMSTYREVADGDPRDGRGSTLDRAITSVRSQSYPRWQLLVMADHPPAPEAAAVRALVASYADPRLECHEQAEWGGTRFPGLEAKRAGASRAEGEYLTFLDADNEWTSWHLERSVEALAADPALDLVYCDTLVRQAGWQRLPLPLHRILPFGPLVGPVLGAPFVWQKPTWDAAAREKLLNLNFIDFSEAVLRRAAYAASGGIVAPQEMEDTADWQLWKNLLAAGRDRFLHLAHIGLYYRTSDLEHHRRYFLLRQLAGLPIPFPMAQAEPWVRPAARSHYVRKHPG